MNSNSTPSKITPSEFLNHIESWLKFIFNKPQNKVESICSNSIERFVNEFYLLKNNVAKIGTKKLTELGSKMELESGSCNDMPMRPCEHSVQFRKMNGFRPARGDFETEMNESFERRFIENLDFGSGVVRGNYICLE